MKKTKSIIGFLLFLFASVILFPETAEAKANVIDAGPTKIEPIEIIEPITLPFNEELIFNDENAVKMIYYNMDDMSVSEWIYRFKYSFTLDKETTLHFYSKGKEDGNLWFTLMRDIGEEYEIHGGKELLVTLSEGDYELIIDDDGYNYDRKEDETATFYEAEVWIEPFQYEINKVTKNAWIKGSKTGHEIVIDGFYDFFDRVEVGGKELALDIDYTKKEGSVIVTLLPEYLEKLDAGEYTFRFIFESDEFYEAYNGVIKSIQQKETVVETKLTIAEVSFPIEVIEPITLPFNEELIFNDENAVKMIYYNMDDMSVSEWIYRFKYSFTLDKETTLHFYSKGKEDGNLWFTLMRDIGEEYEIHGGKELLVKLSEGDYELIVHDDSYNYGRKDEEVATFYEAEVWIEPFQYEINKVTKNAWIKGSKTGHEIVIDGFYDFFDRVEVGGKELALDIDYTKKEGSVIVTLLPEYLEKLDAGEYTFRFIFESDEFYEAYNGVIKSIQQKETVVETKLTIAEVSEEEMPNPTAPPKPTDPIGSDELIKPIDSKDVKTSINIVDSKEHTETVVKTGSKDAVPKTGDNSPIALYGSGLIISVAGILLILKKRKKAEL